MPESPDHSFKIGDRVEVAFPAHYLHAERGTVIAHDPAAKLMNHGQWTSVDFGQFGVQPVSTRCLRTVDVVDQLADLGRDGKGATNRIKRFMDDPPNG